MSSDNAGHLDTYEMERPPVEVIFQYMLMMVCRAQRLTTTNGIVVTTCV